jgi:Mitochondrial carrier protein
MRIGFNDPSLKIWPTTLKIMREEGGLRGLYRGLVPTAFGVAPYVGLNFSVYELLKGYFTPPGRETAYGGLLCGALSGTISQTLTYPFDVLRRKMQTTSMGGKSVLISMSAQVFELRRWCIGLQIQWLYSCPQFYFAYGRVSWTIPGTLA